MLYGTTRLPSQWPEAELWGQGHCRVSRCTNRLVSRVSLCCLIAGGMQPPTHPPTRTHTHPPTRTHPSTHPSTPSPKSTHTCPHAHTHLVPRVNARRDVDVHGAGLRTSAQAQLHTPCGALYWFLREGWGAGWGLDAALHRMWGREGRWGAGSDRVGGGWGRRGQGACPCCWVGHGMRRVLPEHQQAEWRAWEGSRAAGASAGAVPPCAYRRSATIGMGEWGSVSARVRASAIRVWHHNANLNYTNPGGHHCSVSLRPSTSTIVLGTRHGCAPTARMAHWLPQQPPPLRN